MKPDVHYRNESVYYYSRPNVSSPSRVQARAHGLALATFIFLAACGGSDDPPAPPATVALPTP
ncbi:MAG: hypothetical protein ACREBN_03970, partial [Burkholderiaceae bacterium]